LSGESYLSRVVGMLREAVDKRDSRLLYAAALASAEGVYGSVAERLLLSSPAVVEAYARMIDGVGRAVYSIAVGLGLGEERAKLLASLARGEYLAGGNCIPVRFKVSVEFEGVLYTRNSFTCLDFERALNLIAVGVAEPISSGVRLSGSSK
jgi:hypothetical protein